MPSWATTSPPRQFQFDVLQICEIDVDERFVAILTFDADDVDAAFEELDARYLAGEAAANSHIWSLVAEDFERLNRRELPRMTPDVVSIDHRRLPSFAPGGDFARIHPLHLGSIPGHQLPCRGCASVEQPRSCCHSHCERDLPRRL